MTDAELIQRIRSGEEDLFTEVVERYLGRVWALCSSYIRQRGDCEDVVQESFIQCYRRLDSLRDPAAFACWLGKVARTQSLAFLRSASRRQAAVTRLAEQFGTARSTHSMRPDERVQQEELHEIIRAKIDALPPKYREALSLVYTAGHSVAEAAEFAGVSTDAMKKRLQLGREKLRDLMASEVEAALAERQPREQLQARVVAAIPVGTAAWLGNTGVATGAAEAAAWGGKAVILKGALALLAGTIVVVYSMWNDGDASESAQPANGSDARQAALLEKDAPVPGDEAEPPAEAKEAEKARVAKPDEAPETESVPTPDPAAAATESQTMNALFAEQDRIAMEAMEKPLDSPISLDFGQVPTHITEILDFVSEYLETNIVLDWRVVAPPLPKNEARAEQPQSGSPSMPSDATQNLHASEKARKRDAYATTGLVSAIDLRDVTLLQALEHLLYPLGLDFVVEPGFVWISTPANIQREVMRESEERYEEYAQVETALATNVSLRFHDGTHVAEILDFLAEYKDVNIVIDSRVVRPPEEEQAGRSSPGPPSKASPEFASDGIVRYIKFESLKLRDGLKALLRPLNLTFAVAPGYIWVSSPSQIKNESGRKQPDVAISPQLADALDKDITLEFRNELAVSALSSLSRFVNARFVVDMSVVAPEGTDRLKLHSLPAIEIEDLALRHALAALLRSSGLDYVPRDGAIWISTPKRLAEESFEAWRIREFGASASPEESGEVEPIMGTTRRTPIYFTKTSEGRGGALWAAFEFGPNRSDSYTVGETFEHFEVTGVTREPPSVELENQKNGARVTLRPGDPIPFQ